MGEGLVRNTVRNPLPVETTDVKPLSTYHSVEKLNYTKDLHTLFVRRLCFRPRVDLRNGS